MHFTGWGWCLQHRNGVCVRLLRPVVALFGVLAGAVAEAGARSGGIMRSVAQIWQESPSVLIRIVRPSRARGAAPSRFSSSDMGGAAGSLAMQIFSPSPTVRRTRVLFAAADKETNASGVCEQLGSVLAEV